MAEEKENKVEENKEETIETPKEENKEETPKEPEANPNPADGQEEEVKEEPKAEEPQEDEGEDVEVPKKFEALVKQIEEMPVLELNELVKLLEKKFGVSVAATVAAAGPVGGDGAEEKSEFDIELVSDGGAKIPVMKAVKELMGLGLKEAKDLVDGVPSMLKTGAKKEEAEEIKKKIEEAGGKVELK